MERWAYKKGVELGGIGPRALKKWFVYKTGRYTYQDPYATASRNTGESQPGRGAKRSP